MKSKMNSNVLTNHNKLIIIKAQLENSGIYSCQGTLENGRRFKILSEVLIGGKMVWPKGEPTYNSITT